MPLTRGWVGSSLMTDLEVSGCRTAPAREMIVSVLTIAGGIVIAFFVIRFIVRWQHDGEIQRALQARAQHQLVENERERLRLLAIRLRETNPSLYEEAAARVPTPPSVDPSNEKVLAIDDATGKVHAVWPSELKNSHLRRVAPAKMLADIAREAELICRERGLPPP